MTREDFEDQLETLMDDALEQGLPETVIADALSSRLKSMRQAMVDALPARLNEMRQAMADAGLE